MKGGSTRLRLRVVPGARTPGVVGRYGEGWKVRVAAAPERGAANAAVVALLSGVLDLPRDNVTLVAGQTGRDKILEFRGISAGELEHRLATAEKED